MLIYFRTRLHWLLIKTAFRISGVYPWNKSAVHWEKLEAGSLYTDKTSEESEKLLPAVENEVNVMEADSAEVGVSSDWAHNIADPSTHTSNHPTGADIANFVPHNWHRPWDQPRGDGSFVKEVRKDSCFQWDWMMILILSEIGMSLTWWRPSRRPTLRSCSRRRSSRRFLILSTEAGSDSRLPSLGQRRTCSTTALLPRPSLRSLGQRRGLRGQLELQSVTWPVTKTLLFSKWGRMRRLRSKLWWKKQK